MRAFVAVPVPHDVRQQLDAALAAHRGVDEVVRWAHPATWHVTLRFLGDIDEQAVGPLRDALETVAARHEPFEVRLGAPGTFGRSTLWYGLADAGGDALADLAGDVHTATDSVVPDPAPRPFRAHLTVARTRRGRRLPAGLVGRLPTVEAAWPIDRVVLYRSELGPDRAHHEAIAEMLLGVSATRDGRG